VSAAIIYIAQTTRLPLQRFFRFSQNDDDADQIAQMRFSVCCRNLPLLTIIASMTCCPPMPASFQNCAETFGVRPPRPTSPRTRSPVIEFYCGLRGVTGNRLRLW
jgi:hypothetical protein